MCCVPQRFPRGIFSRLPEAFRPAFFAVFSSWFPLQMLCPHDTPAPGRFSLDSTSIFEAANHGASLPHGVSPGVLPRRPGVSLGVFPAQASRCVPWRLSWCVPKLLSWCVPRLLSPGVFPLYRLLCPRVDFCVPELILPNRLVCPLWDLHGLVAGWRGGVGVVC
jgi:hypothetical protein